MKRLSLLIIAIILTLPSKVEAANSVTITCDKEKYLVGEEATCVVKGISDEKIISVSGILNIESDVFNIVPKTPSIWEGDADDGNVQLYTDVEKSGTFEIAIVKVKLKDDAKNILNKNFNLKFENAMFGTVEAIEKQVNEASVDVIFDNKSFISDERGFIIGGIIIALVLVSFVARTMILNKKK